MGLTTQPDTSPTPSQNNKYTSSSTTPGAVAALILIIDDDPDMRFLLRQIMEQEYYRVVEAESGEEGLTVYIKYRPDIVLLDGLLPLMDGFQVCAKLQTLPGGDRTPVLMITGLNDNESVNEAFKAGATDYITKPIHRAVLRQRVRRLLRTHQAEEVLRLRERALAATSNGILITNPNQPGNPIIYVNNAFKNLTGYSEDEMLGQSWHLLNGPNTDHKSIEEVQTAINRIMECKVALKHYRKDGSWFWDELSVYPVYASSGAISNFVGVVQDVTERKQAEEILYQTNVELTNRINELRQRTEEISLLSDMGGLFQACQQIKEGYAVISEMAPRLFKSENGALFIKKPGQQILEQATIWGESGKITYYPAFEANDCWALRRGRLHVVENTQKGLVCKHISPESTPTAYMCIPMIAQSESVGVLYLSSEKSEGTMLQAKQQLALTVAEQIGMALANLNLQETLRNQSVRDPLTGLFNRRYLDEALNREMRRGNRNDRTVGILMIDIDHFKQFNDTYGHEAGDVILKEVALFLQNNIRGDDFACRYGGEEFLLVLSEINPMDAWQRAETIRIAIKQMDVLMRGVHVGPITVSLGVAVFPNEGATPEMVLRAADTALYRAKEQGRDQVVMGVQLEAV